MLTAEFLSMLRCPEDRSALAAADNELVRKLNEAVIAGRLKNRGGRLLDKRLDGALVRADGRIAYPIVDEIPILLVDEGILLDEARPAK
jgi:uncharacterized protein YbaR (Trm112 family)